MARHKFIDTNSRFLAPDLAKHCSLILCSRFTRLGFG